MSSLLRKRNILFAISIILIASGLLILTIPSIPAASSIKDVKGDADALPLFPNKPVPMVRGYHDILNASVKRVDDGLLFSIELADGIEHYRDGYEVVYIWSIEYITASLQKREYKLVIPYFPEEQGLSVKGWYLAVFNASSNEWLIPMLKVEDMRGNRVDIDLDTRVIGEPILFWWSVDVMVNVDTAVHGQPDYLMDSAPDGGKAMLSPLLTWG
ncbi:MULTISPECIES: hypothetical protein [Candidatus Nitrosocaldus]|jgi:hypothetical protein|uniref:Uncharacterized protein n=1 Tax=Candidatus Nitrosocaldus cavascurensis TaxID=2058097 RepID=A0A2K5ASY6_9ARCH|nr:MULTISPECIES: hypothetical protein [Candidatus Nitrosocaldus]SPC34737.1 exported protein of unknown function [Candidatus Nitrosocaldus cavascurensis]